MGIPKQAAFGPHPSSSLLPIVKRKRVCWGAGEESVFPELNTAS